MEIDQKLFDDLYRKHYTDLYRYIARRLGTQNHMVIEDLVHDTFFELWDNKAILATHPNLPAWLTETAKKKMYGWWRKKSSSETCMEEIPVEQGALDPMIEKLENDMFIKSLVDTDDLVLLQKFHIEGHSQKSLADQAGISEGAMKVKLHRIRKKAQEKAGRSFC